MAIFIGIKKIFEENNIYYYKIETLDFGGIKKFIKIDTKKNKIYFADDLFSNPIKTVEPSKNQPIGDLPGVPTVAYAKILVQILKAVDKNVFPENLDYFA